MKKATNIVNEAKKNGEKQNNCEKNSNTNIYSQKTRKISEDLHQKNTMSKFEAPMVNKNDKNDKNE